MQGKGRSEFSAFEGGVVVGYAGRLVFVNCEGERADFSVEGDCDKVSLVHIKCILNLHLGVIMPKGTCRNKKRAITSRISAKTIGFRVRNCWSANSYCCPFLRI